MKRRRRRNPAHERLLRQARKRYESFVQIQGGEWCAICGSRPKTRKLHIDHDHRTMELRGLLCFNCNSLLRPRWNAATLRAAADYLESPPLRNLGKEKGAEAPSSPPLANSIAEELKEESKHDYEIGEAPDE